MEAGGARGGIFSADSYYGFVNVVDRVKEIGETVLMMEEATDEFLIQMKLDGRVQQFVADRMEECARIFGEEIDPVLKFLATNKDDEKHAKVFRIVYGYAQTFLEKGKRVERALADQKRFVGSTTVVSSVNAISNLTGLLNPFMDCEGEAMAEYKSSEALEIEGLEAGLKVVEGGLEILIDSRMNFEMLEKRMEGWIRNGADKIVRHMSLLATERNLSDETKLKLRGLVERLTSKQEMRGRGKDEIGEIVFKLTDCAEKLIMKEDGRQVILKEDGKTFAKKNKMERRSF